MNAWIVPNSGCQNTGDYISKIIVENMCSKFDIDINKRVRETNKLYKLLHKIRNQKIDVRAVRGSETRRILISMGYSCPEIYGDSAVLLPIFYPKDIKKI